MGDAPEQQDIQQEEKPKSKLPFIIGGLLILLIGIVAVSMTLLSGEEGTGTEPPVEEPGYMFEFPENFTVNLAHPDDQYIYNAKITLEIEPKGDKSET
ncbi:hypothetical protein GF373_17135, partial [bacterium]|nr:hypothetical protein [bacterium]